MDDPSKRGDHPLSDGRSRTHRTLPATIPVPTKLASRLSHRVTLEIAFGQRAGFVRPALPRSRPTIAEEMQYSV